MHHCSFVPFLNLADLTIMRQCNFAHAVTRRAAGLKFHVGYGSRESAEAHFGHGSRESAEAEAGCLFAVAAGVHVFIQGRAYTCFLVGWCKVML